MIWIYFVNQIILGGKEMYITKGNKKVKGKVFTGGYRILKMFFKTLESNTVSFDLPNNYKKMHHRPMKRKYKKRKKRIEIGEIFV